MNHSSFLRSMILSSLPLLCALSVAPMTASAQNTRPNAVGMNAHLQSVVLDGSRQSGWYSFPGQSPKLKIHGDEVRIASRRHSTVLLSREADTAGSAAEVSLTRAPISSSSISGLAVMSDAHHAMVIGLEDGNVVLWQLDPNATRTIARQPVNADAPLEFRVLGGTPAEVRFFWRHAGDEAWHPLGNSGSTQVLANWREPLRFGLLLDGPQGSEVTFSNYRADPSNLARLATPALTASLRNGQ